MKTPAVPHHLVLIPDGNRRWAKQHGSEETLYHTGGERLTEVLQVAFELGIRYVSLWIGSYSNLTKRSAEAGVLKRLYRDKFNELADSEFIHENRIHIKVLGEWSGLVGAAASQAINRAMDVTKDYTNGTLSILVGYDGMRERGAALQNLVHNHPGPLPDNPEAAAQLLHTYSWTASLPQVDLLIRTGSHNDPHNSAGFLSMLTDNTQFAFPQVLWPDFTPGILRGIIADFGERERRLGA